MRTDSIQTNVLRCLKDMRSACDTYEYVISCKLKGKNDDEINKVDQKY
jgi:hypothetical protein